MVQQPTSSYYNGQAGECIKELYWSLRFSLHSDLKSSSLIGLTGNKLTHEDTKIIYLKLSETLLLISLRKEEDAGFGTGLQQIQCICCCNLPMVHEHANALWHLHKTQSWWKNRITCLWSSGLPLKKRVFLWDAYWVCSRLGRIIKSAISSPHCARYGERLETVPHLLWTCSFTTAFVQRLSASLSHRFPGQRFGKHFWLIGQITCPLISNAYFLQWTRFWALWTIWTARNNKVFDRNQLHEVSFFKQSLKHSLFVCLQLRDITLQIYNLYFECF